MFEKALQGQRRYWGWLALLVAVAAVGLAFYLQQWQYGLGITGMSRNVSWGLYIANFTFAVGVAASAVMVILPYYLHSYREFGRITILGEFLAVAAVIMAMLFVVVDLGQPARALNILLYPSPRSLLFWDLIVLTVYLLLNIFIGWNVLDAERKSEPVPGWVKPLIYISIPWAVSIHTVTAFIYAGLGARPFWMTAILAPRFLASAFASGPALLIILSLIVNRMTASKISQAALEKVATIVTYALIANVFFLLVESFTAFYSQVPEDVIHFRYLYFGLEGHATLVPFAWTAVILAVAAIILLIVRRAARRQVVLAAACVMVFVSMWIDKGLGLIVPGFIPSPTGEIYEYFPTVPEALITLGVWAVGLLLLTILYKIVISVRESL